MNSPALAKAAAARTTDPVVLARMMDEATHREWRDWDPAAIRDFVRLTDEPEHQPQLDKLCAVQVVLTNPDLQDNWGLLCAVNSAFNHRQAHFEWMDQPSPFEMAWTFRCVKALVPGFQLGAEGLAFVVALCKESGMVYFPWCSPAAEVHVGGDLVPVSAVKALWEQGLATVTAGTLKPEYDEDPVMAQAVKLVLAQDFIRANEEVGVASSETTRRSMP